MTRRTLWPLAGLALLLGGCLLPQPDTPVIPPYAGSGASRPAAAPAVPQAAPAADTAKGDGMISNNAGGLISNNAGGQTGENAGGLISNGAGTQPSSATIAPAPAVSPGAPATLSGKITGMTVKTIVAVPELDGDAAMGVQVEADGSFKLTLPAGAYFLELMVDDTERLRVEKRLDLVAGESRVIGLLLSANPPKATLTEEAPLATPSPSPTAKP